MAELLTKREMAERLRVSPQTVLLWGRSGRIPVVRVNTRTLRYDPDAIIEALRRGRTEGARP